MIVQSSGSDFIELIKALVNLVFDCFMPEMQDEVVSSAKSAKEKRKTTSPAADKDNKSLAPLEDSEYVQMETIEKLEPEKASPAVAPEDAEMESSLVDKKEAVVVSQPKLKKRKTLIFRDLENASNRLYLFNNFCL